MTKVTLANVGSIIDATTAETNINNNSAAIVTAVENTLSRDGTAPNTMSAPLDMNSQPILNLPEPVSGLSPLRLTDASILNGGGTIAPIPPGGTTGQVLAKASNADFDFNYTNSVTSVGVTMPVGITVTGSPITAAGTIAGSWTSGITGTGANVFATSPTLVTPALGTPTSGTLTNATGLPISTGVSGLGTGVATFLATPSSANLATALTDETGTGANVFATSPSLVTPILGTPTSGTLTNATGLPVATGISGLGTGVATFLATPTSANLASAVTNETGSGALVFGTAPTITNIVGTATNDNASAGAIGEIIEGTLSSGSATSITTSVDKDIITISLTAGDWDVAGIAYFIPQAITSVTNWGCSLSTVANTLDGNPGKFARWAGAAQVDGTGFHKAQTIGPFRFSLSATTTVRLVGTATFTASTLTAYGYIRARRVR